ERVQYPNKYRLEYRTADGDTGAITILAIDLRHDLALVHTSGYAPQPLKLQPLAMKGDRAYSVGFPLDVGLTITEGISNGNVDDSFEPRVHYSGAINAGMSGGPGLNAAGEVIGVNVAGYRFEQLVSFLVPVAHVQALRDGTPSPRSTDTGLKKEAAAQMYAHSVELLGALDGAMQTQLVSGYSLPDKIAPFINCNASGNPTSDDHVQMLQIRCLAKAGLYIQHNLYTGDLRYSHYVLSTDKLDAWRFANRLSALTLAVGNYGSDRHVGPYACDDRIVGLKGFDASLLVCGRRYRNFEGLYDFTVRVSSLNSSNRGFASHLDIYGVEFEPGMKFIRRYLEVMAWKP